MNDDTPDRAYKILFEQSSMPLWVVEDESHAFLAVNDAVVVKYGWSREELLGMRASDLLCDEPLTSRADYRQYVPEGRPGVVVTGPYRHRRKDGARLEVRIEATRITFEGRGAFCARSSTRPVGAVSRSGSKTAMASGALSSTLRRTSCSSSTPKARCSSSTARGPFIGRTVVGAKIWDFAVQGSEARIRPLLRKLIESREAVRYEGPGVPALEGSKVWYEVCAIPVAVDGAVERILWTATDITARRTAVEKLAVPSRALVTGEPACSRDGRYGARDLLERSGDRAALRSGRRQRCWAKTITELLGTRWPRSVRA